MNDESIKVELRYSGNNILFKYICKDADDTITTSLKMEDYKIEYRSSRSPTILKNSNYTILFDTVEFYDEYSHIIIETKDEETYVSLKVSGELLDEIRSHLATSAQRNINERENFVSSDRNYNTNNTNNGFEHYNINQVLNTGSPNNRNVNERNEDPSNTSNINNSTTGGRRHTKRRANKRRHTRRN